MSWREKGEQGKQPYADFLKALVQAEIEAETELVAIWRNAAPVDYRAARDLLARRFPDRWGREVERMVGGMIGIGGLMIQINLVSEPEDPETALRNAKLLNLAVRDDEVPN